MGRARSRFGEAFGRFAIRLLLLLLSQGFVNGDSFVQSADRDPEGALERIGMRRGEAFRRKGVADRAVELYEFALL